MIQNPSLIYWSVVFERAEIVVRAVNLSSRDVMSVGVWKVKGAGVAAAVDFGQTDPVASNFVESSEATVWFVETDEVMEATSGGNCAAESSLDTDGAFSVSISSWMFDI